MVVPGAPSGAVISGCYRADRPLYGPYRLVFCVNRGRLGTYEVRGTNLRCDGKLAWQMSDGNLEIGLRRQRCNMGRAWAGATVVCRPRGLVSVILDDLIRELAGQDRQRVVVPGRPTVGRLNCTYRPGVPGYENRQIFANRLMVEPR